MVGETKTLDLAHLAPVLANLQFAAPVAAESLHGGGEPHWRVTLADGSDLVVRSFPPGEFPLYEAYASRLLSGLDLPVKRYLHFDDSRAYLPFDYALTNYIAGRPVRDFAGDADISDLHRQMGALLRQLHEIRLPAFGRLGTDGPTGPARFDQWLDRHIPDVFRDFRAKGADEALASALEEHIAAHRYVLYRSTGAVFAHNDFHPGNVLAERGADGKLRLTGLIDFGSAVASDATSDLAKALFIGNHEMPGSNPALLEGYGPVDHPQPDEALRLNLMLHRVIMWAWIRRTTPAETPDLQTLLANLREMLEEAA